MKKPSNKEKPHKFDQNVLFLEHRVKAYTEENLSEEYFNFLWHIKTKALLRLKQL